MALMNQLGDKTKSIKRPEIPTNKIKPKADVKISTKSLTEKAKPVNAGKSTSSALDGVRRNIPNARKPISDEVGKFKDNGSKQEHPKNVFEYQDLVRIEHSGLGNSPEIADERKPFKLNIERAQKESDDFEKRLSNAKMDLFDSNGNLIDYQKQVSDIDSDISKIKEQFNAIKDTDGNNDLKFNLLSEIQELEVKKNPLEDMAELQNEYASYASYQNALHSGNDEDLRKASYDLSAYNDSFFERRLYALGRTANNMVASAVTLADILRDVGGEIAGNSVEYNARSLIEEGKIDEAKFNEMMSEADQFRAFSATDENNLSTQLRNYSDEITERINTGVGTVESVLGDAVDSSVQFALLYYGFTALGGQVGALAGADNVAKMAGTFGKYGSLASMSTMSATDKYVYCINNGYTMEQSLGNAVLTGALSYMTEQIGVDSFVNVVSGNGGTYLTSLVEKGLGNAVNSSADLALRYMVESAVKNGASEGLEELIEGTLSPVIDSITLGVPLEYNSGDLFKQVMCGTLSGAFMGAPGSYSYAISTNEQYNALINDISQLKGKLEGADLNSNEGKNIVAMLNGAEQALRVYESKSVTAGRIILSTDSEGNAQMSNDNSMLIDSIAPTVDEGIEFEQLQKSMSNAIYGLSSNYMSSIGLDPSELDPIVYSSLSTDARNKITNSIQSGKLTSKSAGEYLEFEKGITTDYQLASQGIHMTMEEFASLPMDDRISAYKIAQISKSTGAPIVVQKNMTTEDGERVTGINKKGILYVDPSDPSSTVVTVFHEVAHSLEYTKAYKNLSNAVTNSIKSSGKSFDALVAEAKPLYENEINRDFEKSGLPESMRDKFATEYAQKEVIAEYFGMMVANDFMVDASKSKNIVKMATDIGFIKSLVKYQNGPAYRIYNNMISYFGDDVSKAKNAFNRAIIELNSENSQNGTKYQFITQNSLVNAFYKNGTADSEKLLDFHSTAMDLLYSAMEYENDGMPMHEIHKNTGWYKHDGVWKFEFYDEAFVHSVYIDAIDAMDNPVYKTTKDYPVPIARSNPSTLTDEIFGGELGVYFDYSLDFYTRGYVNIHDGKFDIYLNPNSFKKETIAHELQHLFQKILEFEEYKLSESELKTKEATDEYLDSLIAGDEYSKLAEDIRYDEYWTDKSEVEARVAGDAYVNEENRIESAYTIPYKPYDISEYYPFEELEDGEYIVPVYDGEMEAVPIEDFEDDFIIEIEDSDSPKYQKLAYNYGNYIRDAIDDSSKKSESMQAYGGRHGTGEFGTGTYFVGSVTSDSYYGSKTQNTVDFDMNGPLFRPINTEEGFKLSNFLRHLNNAVLNDGRMFNRFDEIDSAKERVNEVIDNTVEVNYPSYSIEEAEYNDFLIKNPEPEYVYPEYYEEDLDNSLSALFLDQIDNGKARIKNEDEYRRYELEFKNWSSLKAKWLNEQISKYGTVSTAQDVANALSVEFGLNVKDMEDVTDFSKELDRAVIFAEKGLENRQIAESEIMFLQGYNQDYLKAMDDAFAGDYVNGSDTPSTVFMKSLGYNGIDVTGIDRLDNFNYGSVIYDVNPDSIIETKFNRDDFRDEAIMRDNAVIAPYYDNQLTLENREQLKNVEETFVNRANAIAESLGTKVIDYEENIGGFVNANDVALNELSYTFILEGNDREKADMFANLMADMGNEVQEAVIAYDYRDGGDESFDGWEIRIGVKDAEEASKALRENGITDYTVGRTSGLVKIYSPFKDEQRIIELKEILGDNYDGTECTIRKYNSRYQDSGTRRQAYEEWVKSNVRESTEDGNNSQNRLERIIRQALDNLDVFTSNVPQRAVEAKQVRYRKAKIRASKIDTELFKPSYMYDSEGNMLTVGQDRYFSKSQNLDHNGDLLYMYHGGKEAYDGGRINEFNPEMSDDGRSLFFTSNINTAGSYSNNALGEYAPFRYDSVDDINRVLNNKENSLFGEPSFIEYVQNEDGTVSAVPSEYAKETAPEFVKRFQPVTYANIDEAYNAIVNEEQEYKTRQNYDYNESGTNNAVYLNIENPVKLDANRENWNTVQWEVKDQLVGKDLKCYEIDVKRSFSGNSYIVNGEEFDEYELEEQFGSVFATEVINTIDDGYELLFEYKTRDGDSMYSYMNTLRDVSDYAYFTGHDGMICRNVSDTGFFGLFEDSDGDMLGEYSTVATVFNSNQAKSVNNLAPTDHPDTRYRKSVLDWGNGNVEFTNAPLNQELKKQFEDATKQYVIASDRKDSEVDESIVSTPESEELASKYGAIERGENPVREVNIPKSTDGKNRVHKGIRTVAESKHVTDEEVVSMLNSLTSESRGTYNVRTNDATTKRAMKTVLESDTAELDSLLLAQDELSLDRYAQLSIRLSEIQNAGEINTEHGQEMLSKWLDMQNEAGSMVQYTRAFKNLDPERRVSQVEKRVKKVQSELDSKYGNKAPKIEVDSELIDNLRKASSENDIKKAGDAITENIMNQVPPTLMEKIDAWRFISMLANPRTHIRNIAGNFAFGGLYSYRNTIATLIEQSMVKSGKIDAKNAVHSFITSEDKELMKRAEAFYETHKSEIERNSNGKYKDSRRHSRPFKTEWINTLYELNGKLLSKEDTLSSKPRYVKTLAEMMKARGITSEATDAELFNIADYALAESERATFNNRNSFAHKLSEIERKLDNETWSKHPVEKTGALIMKAMVPFKNTPMNIINQAMDFSPLGLVWNSSKGVYEYSYDKSHGTSKFNANEFVNKLSSGVAGSSLFIVGFFLAKAGILKGKSKAKDKKEKKFREDHGEQEYSINLNIGDKRYSYTIDWLAPAVIPMFMGQALYDSMGDGLTPDDVFSIATGVIDPITEMTMLQSLNTSLKSYNSEGLSGVGMNAMSSYISQFIPTMFGQVARSIDATSRTTYPYDGYLEKTGRSIQSRIPIANMGLNPSVKSDGTIAKNNGLGAGLAGRMFMNMISPGYGTKIEYDEYDEELMRLFESNGDSSVLPSSINRNISYTDKNGNKHEFNISYEDYDDYQIDRWSTEKKYVDEFIGSNKYKSLGDEERTRIISEIRKYGGLYAKDKYLQKNGIKFEDSSYEKAKGAIDAGLGVGEYFIAKDFMNEITGDYAKKERVDYISGLDVSDKAKNFLYDSQYGDSKIAGYANDMDVSDKERLAIKSASSIEGIKDSNGKTISNTKALAVADAYADAGVLDDVIEYINENGLEPKDLGLSKSLMGMSSSKLSSEYEKYYREQFGNGDSSEYGKYFKGSGGGSSRKLKSSKISAFKKGMNSMSSTVRSAVNSLSPSKVKAPDETIDVQQAIARIKKRNGRWLS